MITAKEIAKQLNISEASVSIALNGRPGVSEALRRKIRETALEMGYDFSRLSHDEHINAICFIIYIKSGAVVSDTPFFDKLFAGVAAECKKHKVQLIMEYVNGTKELNSLVNRLPLDTGLILLATEMSEIDCEPIVNSQHFYVIMDAYFESINSNYVLINNVKGAYTATEYLINKTGKQPGYLRSSYPIANFDERADGFYKAIRAHGMSTSSCIVHKLTPSAEGAYLDLMDCLESGEKLAPCYFADNDLIAAGAIRAFKAKNYRIPEDIAIIGFDNVPMCEWLDPPLSSVNVPKEYMGSQAVLRLLSIMGNKDQNHVKIEIETELVKLKSC